MDDFFGESLLNQTGERWAVRSAFSFNIGELHRGLMFHDLYALLTERHLGNTDVASA